GLEIAEPRKGLEGRPFLAHEQERRRRREQQHRRRGPQRRLVAHQSREPLAAGAVADLIVVLEEVDEGARRQVGGALPPRPAEVARYLALVDEALCEAASEQGVPVPGIVGVVSLALPGTRTPCSLAASQRASPDRKSTRLNSSH